VSLRLRLAITYGLLAGLVVLVVSMLTYSVHSRGSYDELDLSLLNTAAHLSGEHTSDPNGLGLARALAAPLSPELVVRSYDSLDHIQAATANSNGAPQFNPGHFSHHPSGVPYDLVTALAPPLQPIDPGQGVFGIITLPDGVRWRVYVLSDNATPAGHIVAMAPLDSIDGSVARLRWMMASLTIAASALTFAGGALVAGRALQPVDSLTNTAAAIASSRRFDKRVPSVNRKDELGRMAATFNEMLDSLQEAYQSQQRFVADASHELRAPLTAIQANLNLLERQTEMAPAERVEALREADREAARLARLVADLLALARADAGVMLRRQPVELDRMLLDAVGEARHLAKSQTIEVREIEPVQVCGDPDRLKQLVIILVDNALKYTPPTGIVTVGLQIIDQMARIRVQDNGVGIASNDLPHVFERFYRVDPARGHDPGGTGLGLPIAKWIVEQHRGAIAISSEPWEGTTVIVSLPITGPHVSPDLT
jgi:two-component system, OmpR family, sensor kinase